MKIRDVESSRGKELGLIKWYQSEGSSLISCQPVLSPALINIYMNEQKYKGNDYQIFTWGSKITTSVNARQKFKILSILEQWVKLNRQSLIGINTAVGQNSFYHCKSQCNSKTWVVRD